MKNVPFMIRTGIPYDLAEGNIIVFDNKEHKVTKIKSIKYLDMRTVEIIGLSKEII